MASLDRDISATMKGLAIMSIALHNFIHLERFHFTQENEMTFSVERTYAFFCHVSEPSFSLLFEILSFIGWCGVPVFVFLSGYGLSMKYEHPRKSIDNKSYIYHSYKKLLLLVFPAMIFFVVYQLSEGLYLRAAFSVFSSLTFANTLINIGISIPSAAPPYWYFALTFQLYLLYLLLYKITNKKLIIVVAVAFLLLQYFLSPEASNENLLKYIRKNSIGWLPFFIFGILFARRTYPVVVRGKWQYVILTLLSFVLLFITNVNYCSWLLMPFVAIVFFYSASQLANFTSYGKRIGNWLGKYSSFIFVTHPIGILLTEKIMDNLSEISIWGVTLFYVVLTIVLSVFYKLIHFQFTKLI